MKKQISFLTAFLITLCFILFTNGTMYAQKYTYKPLALEGAHWWVGYTDDNMPPWAPWDHYQYVIRGDTVLDNITYKKVYYRELTDENPHLIEYEILSRLLRDDTLNKKVYAVYLDYPQWECSENEDVLLYDYGLSVGDTMNTCLIVSGPAIVQSIGYEFLYEEERKILYELSGRFIEGIGSNYGVFEWGGGSKNTKGFGWMLFDYCLGTDEECGCQWVGVNDRVGKSTFKIYPNPFSGSIITLVPQKQINQSFDVKLYDITGKEVYKKPFESLTEAPHTLQLPARITSGTSPFLLWVGNTQQQFFKQLIIKQ
jgi:hypothetical protein